VVELVARLMNVAQDGSVLGGFQLHDAQAAMAAISCHFTGRIVVEASDVVLLDAGSLFQNDEGGSLL
jgi:hypothetical protein